MSNTWPLATKRKPCLNCGKDHSCRNAPDGKKSVCWHNGNGGKVIDIADRQKQSTPRRIIDVYPYVDAEGVLLYEAVRYSPKDFRQRKPNGNGGHEWKLNGTPRVLYKLPELMNAREDRPGEWRFIVEGEKDTNNLTTAGLIATTGVGGAGKWLDSYSDQLAGERACIVADKDTAGRNHAEQVARSLQGKAATIKVIELPGDVVKDASDFLSIGGTAEQIVAMAEAAPEWTPRAEELPAEGNGNPRSRPILTCFSDIEPKTIDWAVPGVLPLGRVSLWAGPGGVGKGMATTDLAARITTGTPWHTGEPVVLGDVLIISGEDDPNDALRPRLDAHHANVNRAHLMRSVERCTEDGEKSEVFFTLEDIRSLEAAVQSLPNLKLVIIDPIGSFIGGRTDSNTDNQVRAVMAPSAMLAEKYGFALLAIAHHRKTTGRSADELVLGSRAFTALARVVWHFFEDPNDPNRRYMLPGKINIAQRAAGSAYSIGGDPATIRWDKTPVDQTADQYLAEMSKPGPEPFAQNEAEEMVREMLANGARAAKDIRDEAKDRGINQKALQRVRAKLGIVQERCSYTKQLQWRFKNENKEPVQSVYLDQSVEPVEPVQFLEDESEEVDRLDKIQEGQDRQEGVV